MEMNGQVVAEQIARKYSLTDGPWSRQVTRIRL